MGDEDIEIAGGGGHDIVIGPIGAVAVSRADDAGTGQGFGIRKQVEHGVIAVSEDVRGERGFEPAGAVAGVSEGGKPLVRRVSGRRRGWRQGPRHRQGG